MATVLLIEDDAANREPMGRLLRAHGYEVLRAANGGDALDLMRNCAVDLILLDVMMPEMDGFEFLRAMRADARYQSMPVVMVTALTDTEALHRGDDLGVSGYLIKSRFSSDQLLQTVKQNIGAASVQV